MAVNDSFAKGTNDLADGGDLIVDGSGADTGAVNITEIFASGGVDVYREVDTVGDGSWAVSVNIDSESSNFGSQGNNYICSQSQNVRLRINNNSGSPSDIGAAGYEVDD